ncbi:MAG: NAD(P)-binding domain-containing protein [Proteobacteria bacterium]|jgi:4-hydroxybutyrate dehydrogenase/sulfolactaldehyde 3-reductase|nr:NAD(P)-binding domain-containing protein [Pseudomonadota bacterium]
MAKIGFVGLGQMGSAMCPHLIKNGHHVTVYDVSQEAVAALEKQGAKGAESPKEAAQGCEAIFAILPIGSIVEKVVFGPDGIADGMSGNAIFVDMSTILPDETRQIGKRLVDRGFSMVDAPVGRTSAHAVNGKSTFMVGGKKQDIDRVVPFLECMGEAITYCGELGSGSVVKLVNNYISAVSNLVTAEGLALGLKSGVSQDVMVEVISKTPAGLGHITTAWPEKALCDNPLPAFMLDLARKDIGLALTAGASSKVPLSTGSVAREVYNIASAAGRGEEDWTTGIYRTLKNLSKISE